MTGNDDPSSESQDCIDRLLARWAQARPDLNWSALAMTGRLRLLSLMLDAAAAAVGERHGVKRGELEILVALFRSGQRGSATPTELAQQVWITAASITRRVDQLVKLGLVERDRDSKDDRREVIVRLTARGQEIAQAAAAEVYESESKAVGGLDLEEQRMLVALMRKLLVKFDMLGTALPGRLLRSARRQPGAAKRAASGIF